MLKQLIMDNYMVVIGSLTDSFVKISLILILLNKRNFFKNWKFLLSVILYGMYFIFSYHISDNGLRVILLFTLPCIFILFIIGFSKKKIYSTIFITFMVWLAVVLCDVLFNIIITGFLKIDMNTYKNSAYLVDIINYLLLFSITILFYIKPIRKKIMKLANIQIHDGNIYYFLIIFISVIIFGIMFYLCIFEKSGFLILLTAFIMVIVYTSITLVTIKTTNTKNKIKSEYNILLSNLTEYENLLDRQRTSNHENKNQLLVIKGMIDKNENVIDYIDTLIETQYKDNNNLMSKTNRIPSGGLRGLVYYKLLLMKEKYINVNLEIDTNLRKIDFSEISIKTMQELCKIIGVFLDNSIQCVELLNEKNINIFMQYDNNKLIIKISNNYSKIELDKIENKGYTTKGKGHGYGLKLVKKIIDNNECFENYKVINGKMFSQVLELNINKSK